MHSISSSRQPACRQASPAESWLFVFGVLRYNCFIMLLFSWRTRRQFFYFAIFALAILAIIGGIVWYFWPEPTCSDKKQNQGEQGIDCGGPCTPCLGEIKDISQKWVRFFKNREGFYDIAALIENSNLFAGIPNFKYTFKLYDSNNVLITIKEGSTFINPGEQPDNF